jgi:hypothetical protein
MVYRKGELSKSTINREWPHQVAVAASFVAGRNFMAIHRSAGAMTETASSTAFAERDHAERFHSRFGGERVDPATRPKWSGTSHQFDPAAEARYRNGRCAHCDD